MPIGLEEGYKTANAKDYLDQHLDMETAMLRLQLEHNETLKKFMHHTKLVAGQIGKILDGIPTDVTNSDGSLTTLVEKDDMDLLKKMSKQLDVFKLSDNTPELERDIYIYTLTHNLINAYELHNSGVNINDIFLQVITLGAVHGARAMAEMYWEYSVSDNITDLLDEHGHAWKFIDPNDEVKRISEEDNLTPTEARAKIMQRSIDALYDITSFKSDNPYTRYRSATLHSMIFLFSTAPIDVYEHDVFIKALKHYDPSRYPAETDDDA